jgi:hypothetical protein
MIGVRRTCHARIQRPVFSHMLWQSPTIMDAAISLFKSPLPNVRYHARPDGVDGESEPVVNQNEADVYYSMEIPNYLDSARDGVGL